MALAVPEHTAGDERVATAPVGGFRADVEGLRAVAIALVVLFHAGLGTFAGGFLGVDVFFVISGFLITGQLVTELERSGRIALPAFYARRARRILPAAGVVLVVAALGVGLLTPRAQWSSIGGDIVAAALYVINWRSPDQPFFTPVDHFWSLAVEEQFYLCWPLLLIVAALVARRVGARPRRAVTIAVAAVIAGSFAWSVIGSGPFPDPAYYATTARMWQLAVGGGVALAAGRLARLPRPVALGLAWVGLAAVLASGVLFALHGVAWPGYLAAVPTLGAAAVIAGGCSSPRGGPQALLGLPPVRWIGRMSYSIYLWHWVALYLAAEALGELGPRRTPVVLAGSVLLAWLTNALVENPVRRRAAANRSAAAGLAVGAAFTLAAAAAGALLCLAATI